MELLEWIRSHALALPSLAKFALGMAIIVGVPRLSRRVKLPAVVGLLLSGVVVGPHVLGVFAVDPAIVLGSLLASHTLLALPTITRLREMRLEPVTVTAGATVMSDTL